MLEQQKMSRATVELDFFALEKESSSSSKTQFQKFLDRRRSFRGVQGGISKIDPELIKSVIDKQSSHAEPCGAKTDQDSCPDLPLYCPALSRQAAEGSLDTAPLTIFFNGTVAAFDVTKDKAEKIFRLAVEESNSKKNDEQKGCPNPKDESTSSGKKEFFESLNGDLPIARRKSLHRFLEKRKGRLTSVSPLGCRN